MAETRELERRLRADADLNHRQLALLGHALRHQDATYTIAGHQRSHSVVHRTARMDLVNLAERGLLEMRKIGRQFVFHPARDLERRLRRPRRRRTGGGSVRPHAKQA